MLATVDRLSSWKRMMKTMMIEMCLYMAFDEDTLSTMFGLLYNRLNFDQDKFFGETGNCGQSLPEFNGISRDASISGNNPPGIHQPSPSHPFFLLACLPSTTHSPQRRLLHILPNAFQAFIMAVSPDPTTGDGLKRIYSSTCDQARQRHDAAIGQKAQLELPPGQKMQRITCNLTGTNHTMPRRPSPCETSSFANNCFGS